MELKDTISLMTSQDYKDRFKAEYYQTKIRYEKLKAMLKKWDEGKLNFKPTCDRSMYDYQIEAMIMYLNILEDRAKVEKVEL